MVTLTKVDDKMFITDEVHGDNPHRVFPIMEDESIYFARRIKAKKNDVVLDIGTGSGILSIFAASKAKEVYAVDINKRALKFAEFNAFLNHSHNKIKFLEGNALDPVRNMKFDLVIMNPPFNVTPPEVSGASFSDGGEDGLKLTRIVMDKIKNNLKENSIIQIITYSPGSEKEPEVLSLIKDRLGTKTGIEITHVHPKIATKKFLKGVFGNKHKKWVDDFCEKYPYYYYVFLTIYAKPSKPFLKTLPLDAKHRENRFDGSWKARINRRKAILGYQYT